MSLAEQSRMKSDHRTLLKERKKDLMLAISKIGEIERDMEGGRYDPTAVTKFLKLSDDEIGGNVVLRQKASTPTRRPMPESRMAPPIQMPTSTPSQDRAIAALEKRTAETEVVVDRLGVRIAEVLKTCIQIVKALDELPASSGASVDTVELTAMVEEIVGRLTVMGTIPDEVVAMQVTDALEKMSAAFGQRIDGALETAVEKRMQAVLDDLARRLPEPADAPDLGFLDTARSEIEQAVRRMERLITEFEEGRESRIAETIERLEDRIREVSGPIMERMEKAASIDHAGLVREAIDRGVTDVERRSQAPSAAIDEEAVKAMFSAMEERLLASVDERIKARRQRPETALVSSHPKFDDARKVVAEALARTSAPMATQQVLDVIKSEIPEVDLHARDAGNRLQRMGFQRVTDPEAPHKPYWWLGGVPVPEPYSLVR